MKCFNDHWQEERSIADDVFDQLQAKSKTAASGWLGTALKEMRNKSVPLRKESFRSFVICTAGLIIESSPNRLLEAFVSSEEMASLAQDQRHPADNQKNLDLMVTKAASAINRFANEGWRMGLLGRRTSHYIGLLRIIKARNESTNERLKALPLHLVAAIGMTASSGVQWLPPSGEFKVGVSPALADHIIKMIRETTIHLTCPKKSFCDMDYDYTGRATRLLELICRWEGRVDESCALYFEPTKYHLLAPVLNPLMPLKFKDYNLKRLQKKAKTPVPLEFVSLYYPFRDFATSSSSSEDTSGSDEEEIQEIQEIKEGEKKEGGAEEKKEKEQELTVKKEEKKDPTPEEKKLRDQEELEKKVQAEKLAAASRERREEAEAARQEKKKREEEEGKAKQLAARKERGRRERREEDRTVRYEPSPNKGAKFGRGFKKPRRDLEYREDVRPGGSASEPTAAWSYSRIRETQKTDSRTCQMAPNECHGFSFDRRTKRYVACPKTHPWAVV